VGGGVGVCVAWGGKGVVGTECGRPGSCRGRAPQVGGNPGSSGRLRSRQGTFARRRIGAGQDYEIPDNTRRKSKAAPCQSATAGSHE
jgi:hypothetical protein